jgi:hypothetical protein
MNYLRFWINLNKITKLRSAVIVSFIVLFSVSIFISGVVAHKTGLIYTLKLAVSSPLRISINYFKSLTISPPERIYIDMKFKNLQKLQKEREIALNNNFLISNEYVPAAVRYNDVEHKVKMRLKGDWTDHLQGEKWSYRMRVKEDKTLFGMKQFSIHHPKTRNFIYEWLFHKVLEREDIIFLRYDFINVIFNGKNLGIYAIEEHFEKRLIENNRRKEGPIIRFSEDLVWEEELQYRYQNPEVKPSGYGTYLSSNIDAFQTSSILNDSIPNYNYLKAISLLESFRNGKLSTSDVFDIEKLSTFMAITDLFGAEHGSRWHNVRFYYNPITSKLEPIGFDGSAGKLINTLVSTSTTNSHFDSNALMGSYYNMLFRDDLFYSMYIEKLMMVSKEYYLDSIFNDLDAELDMKLAILYKEWPEFNFDKNIFYKNQSYIRYMLNPQKAIHSFLKSKSEGLIELSIGNIQALPVNVISIRINDTITIFPKNNIILSGKLTFETIDYRSFDFIMPKEITLLGDEVSSIMVNHEIYGSSSNKIVEVFPWNNLDKELINNDFPKLESNISMFNFLVVNEVEKQIIFKQGSYKIHQSIHIPAGYRVYINDGTTLDLLSSSSIVSYSSVNFLGTEDNPIIVTSSDSSGQGIFILKTDYRSYFDHVKFDQLSNPNKNGWELSGAITFYEANVSIDNSTFSNNKRGDDYLNIIKSSFDLNNTIFTNTLSDAFDSDFSKGILSNSSFINCGNDGIDISGTNMSISNVYMDNIGDKGISTGENSNVIAKKIKIVNSEIAVCSKDMSEIKISEISLQNNNIGFAAFQKKSEFGPGKIIATDVKMETQFVPYLLETSSTCIIDGETINSNNDKVKDILYGVIYGKKSNAINSLSK